MGAYAGMFHPFEKYVNNNRGFRSVLSLDEEELIREMALSRYKSGEFYTEFRCGKLNSLMCGLTGLGWATWFGGEFAREVDFNSIKESGFPVFHHDCGYLIQVTENISDVIYNFSFFEERRRELISLFRDDIFLIDRRNCL
jgi:hypothetical protein